ASLFSGSLAPRRLRSFPTRRSSDLPALRVGRLGRLAVRVGLLARWVRRSARLLRLPWLLAPAGIRLRPGLRGPLAAGLVVDVPLVVISAPGRIRTHPQLQIDHAIFQRKSRRKLLLHYQLNISCVLLLA